MKHGPDILSTRLAVDYEARTSLGGGVSRCPTRIGARHLMTPVRHLSE
jgi:hypothetical protein